MLKNPNQKVLKRMARNALKVNRRKTITLFLAVLLSSFLVFTIFTVGDSYFRLQKIQNIRISGAEFDAIMYGVTDEQKQMCENNPDIVLTGTVGVCGWVEKTDQDSTPNVGLIWADDGYWTQMMEPVREKLEGSYPTALDEIMVTKSALKNVVTKILMSAIPLLCLMEHMRESLQGLFESVESGTDMDPRNSFMSRKNSMINRDGSFLRQLPVVTLWILSKK